MLEISIKAFVKVVATVKEVIKACFSIFLITVQLPHDRMAALHELEGFLHSAA